MYVQFHPSIRRINETIKVMNTTAYKLFKKFMEKNKLKK